MENKPRAGSAVGPVEPRYALDLPARFVIDEGKPENVRLINLSRNGFRVAAAMVLPAGRAVRLEVDGWPRLAGRVVWCDNGRIGCLVENPPSEAIYAMMCAAADGREREAF